MFGLANFVLSNSLVPPWVAQSIIVVRRPVFVVGQGSHPVSLAWIPLASGACCRICVWVQSSGEGRSALFALIGVDHHQTAVLDIRGVVRYVIGLSAVVLHLRPLVYVDED